MSLVNEALKRARQLQPPPPAPLAAGPQLRPAEREKTPKRDLGLILSMGLGVLAGLLFLAGALLLIRAYSVRARQAELRIPAPVTEARARTPVASAAPAAVETKPVPQAGLVGAAVTQATNTLARAAAPANAPSLLGVSTNAPLAEPPRPKPAPLKLQAIIYNPQRPSALISGKTVFVGDRIGEWRLLAISADSAKLVGPRGTNLLTLE